MCRVKMSNSDYISLSCELAHHRVEESDTSYIIEDKDGTRYTEDGQDLFNDYYGYYQSILAKYIKEII
jgi:hypothetical protein|tara:strand:- start:422 stop:625 length:204 start_codon:yes stop_codon:yes gene_type:complete